MSLVSLEIPKVGLVMENARLVRWLKSVGDLVKQGEPLLELETEKSVVEIEAAESGRLVEILMQVDQEARVGDRVAWLENDLNAPAVTGAGRGASSGGVGGSSAVAGAAAAGAGGVAPGAGGVAAGASGVAPGAGGVAAGASGVAPGASGVATGRIKSSPVARRVAAENAVDLRQVQPTGPRGRVQLSDVRRAIESRQGQNPTEGALAGARAPSSRPQAPGPGQARGAGLVPGAEQAPGSGPRPSVSGPQPLSSMRRAVARSMTLSNATVPQFFVERAVDWTNLQAVRAKLLAELPAGAAKPSVNDFLLQAIARTLLAHPQLNATFSGDVDTPDAALLPATGTHIGLVVAVENGLLVPVLHEVERVGIVELARRRSDTVQRALGGRLKRDELEGATFSLSNLGVNGPDRFTAIINPPQSAILAVGRQRDCVVAIDGGIHVRPVSQLTLTVDHRVADGRLAADFLASLVETLEGHSWQLN